ncbi:MAG: FtsQ-type POTRA domain-containing protein [Candidatus Spechtbacteria bacterium]|nr:FtsQ-type POTRA domain-containing protein [Candidatus Spechtbacteria bacterium]
MHLTFFQRKKRNHFIGEEKEKGFKSHTFSILPKPSFSHAVGMGVFLLLTIGGFAIYALFFSKWARITTISVNGSQFVESEQVLQIAQNAANGKKFLVLPLNSYAMFPAASIIQAEEKAFPRLASVSVSRSFPHIATITVKERQIAGIWCVDQQVGCAFIDSEGVIFESAPSSTQGMLFFLVEDGRAATVPDLGTQVLDAKMYVFLQDLRGSLSQAKIIPARIRIKSNEEVDITFNGSSQSTWDAYFSTQESPQYQARVLARILSEEVGDKQIPLLSYIDMRVKNKVFYKFKDQEPVAPVTQP